MMIQAYPQFYLADAQQNLGVMFDYALRIKKNKEDLFFSYFVQSDAARKFERGNPKYIAGISGLDLYKKVLDSLGEKTEISNENIEHGSEFWTGWVLAYYQWYSGLKFSDLNEYGLRPSVILSHYILHEADISKFTEFANKLIRNNKNEKQTRLKRLRQEQGLTQAELSALSGVSLRMIQLYEQRQSDINKASGESINALAKALHCNFYQVMEINLDE